MVPGIVECWNFQSILNVAADLDQAIYPAGNPNPTDCVIVTNISPRQLDDK